VKASLPHHYTIPFLEQYSFNFEPDPDPVPLSPSTPATSSDNLQQHREKRIDKLNASRSIGNVVYNTSDFDETEN